MAKKGLREVLTKGLRNGLFITFEGCEGCGKSTQGRLLFRYLKALGFSCVMTREPGGTRLGEAIRRILLRPAGIDITAVAELFLFEAARAEIVDEIIAPALRAGKIVICDRFSDATLAYQGYGSGVDLGAIKALDRIATGSLKPDLTILLDIDVARGLARAKKKGLDRMEARRASYHRQVRAGYMKLAAKEPSRIKIIKVQDGIDQTQGLVRRKVERVIRRYKRSG